MFAAEVDVPVPTWIGELAFGAIVVLALLGYVWFKPAVRSLMERMEKAEAQRDALIEVYQEEIIPALRDANVGASRQADVLEKAVAVLGEVKALLVAKGP